VDDPSPTGALDPGCNADAWGEDLSLVGSYFQATAAWHCPLGSTGRIIGYRPEIVVFCVRQIPGATAGCALGPLDDYLTIEGQIRSASRTSSPTRSACGTAATRAISPIRPAAARGLTGGRC
jgi:hypothetical protein